MAEPSSTTSESLARVPPVRLGAILRRARRRRGLALRAAARRACLRKRDLRSFERGRARVPYPVLLALADVYETTIGDLVPPRVPISLLNGVLTVGGESRLLPSAADELLAAYAEIIPQLRNVPAGSAIELRDDDLAVLAAAVGADVDDVEARIVALLGCTRDEAGLLHRELLRRRLLTPIAVAGFGAVAFTGVAVASPARPTLGPPGGEPAAPPSADVWLPTVPARVDPVLLEAAHRASDAAVAAAATGSGATAAPSTTPGEPSPAYVPATAPTVPEGSVDGASPPQPDVGILPGEVPVPFEPPG